MLRFANSSSAAFWNREHVESVQIDVPETLGISDRAQFYDATGAVLDMLVTHLFQVTAEVAMEPPASLDAPGLQAARNEVFSCFRPLDPNEVVLGQFDGYREVPGVDPHSGRDTFVAARLWIDNPRWQHVPFYLRTGKRLAASKQKVRAAQPRTASCRTDRLTASATASPPGIRSLKPGCDGGSRLVWVAVDAKHPGQGRGVPPCCSSTRVTMVRSCSPRP